MFKAKLRNTFPWRKAQDKARAKATARAASRRLQREPIDVSSSSSSSSSDVVRVVTGASASASTARHVPPTIKSKLICKAFEKNTCNRGELCRFPAPRFLFGVVNHSLFKVKNNLANDLHSNKHYL
jgi:hypothetical protein